MRGYGDARRSSSPVILPLAAHALLLPSFSIQPSQPPPHLPPSPLPRPHQHPSLLLNSLRIAALLLLPPPTSQKSHSHPSSSLALLTLLATALASSPSTKLLEHSISQFSLPSSSSTSLILPDLETRLSSAQTAFQSCQACVSQRGSEMVYASGVGRACVAGPGRWVWQAWAVQRGWRGVARVLEGLEKCFERRRGQSLWSLGQRHGERFVDSVPAFHKVGG